MSDYNAEKGESQVNEQLTRDFCFAEFRCKCGCGEEKLHYPEIRLLALDLQLLRNELNMDPELGEHKERAPHGEFRIMITSAFRCRKHNREIGGVEDSNHPKAWAVDFTVPGLPTELLWERAKKHFPGCIYYKGRHFVHGDRRLKTVQFVKLPSPTEEPEVA